MNWTKTPPTKPGAYWWREFAGGSLQLTSVVAVGDWLYCQLGDDRASYSTTEACGEWCGPLVPVEEVKNAWKEGSNCGQCDCRVCSDYDAAKWLNSRARKIVEGEL